MPWIYNKYPASIAHCVSSRYRRGTVDEQNYLLGELESLGFKTVRLNEFNDNWELHNLVVNVKEDLIREYWDQSD